VRWPWRKDDDEHDLTYAEEIVYWRVMLDPDLALLKSVLSGETDVEILVHPAGVRVRWEQRWWRVTYPNGAVGLYSDVLHVAAVALS